MLNRPEEKKEHRSSTSHVPFGSDPLSLLNTPISEHKAVPLKEKKQEVENDSLTYNSGEASLHEMRLYPLKSGNYLIQQFTPDEEAINYYLCDLSKKASEKIYQHLVREENDHYQCYLPDGPVLLNIIKKPFRAIRKDALLI